MKKILIVFLLFSICLIGSCNKKENVKSLDKEEVLTDEKKQEALKASSDETEVKQIEEKEINVKYCLLDKEANFKVSNLNVKTPRYVFANDYPGNNNDRDFKIMEALIEVNFYLDKDYTIPYDKNVISNEDLTLYMEEENVLGCYKKDWTDIGEFDEEKGRWVNTVFTDKKPFLNGIVSSKSGKVVLDESEIEYLDIEKNEFIESPLMIKYRGLLNFGIANNDCPTGMITPFGSERPFYNNSNIKEIVINTDLLHNKEFDYAAAIVSYPGLERIVINGDINAIKKTMIFNDKKLKEVVFNGNILKTTEKAIELYTKDDNFITIRFNGEINNIVENFITGDPNYYEVIYKYK